ncbi:hypothetical protein ACIRPX_16020 [Streptomyces sp. NPDC101225]|uniref:hypothetical protein n=1 Tax=Streptomyces sp. NPDC101225 TaxID=3366135 RepID=UPI0037FCFB8A
MEYSVAFDQGVLSRCELRIIGTSGKFRAAELRNIRNRIAHSAPPVPGTRTPVPSSSAMQYFAEECERTARVPQRAVWQLLTSDEAVVPEFGSPPHAWLSLNQVVTQAVGAAAAIGSGGGIPTMFLAYGTGVVLVQFVNPVVAEAGRAVADGVGYKIRKAFGLRTDSAVGPQGSTQGIEGQGAESLDADDDEIS